MKIVVWHVLARQEVRGSAYNERVDRRLYTSVICAILSQHECIVGVVTGTKHWTSRVSGRRCVADDEAIALPSSHAIAILETEYIKYRPQGTR